MHKQSHSKNTVRYFLLVALFLISLFFSNDFGLLDVEKTAIVTAVGVDREEEEFILTSQVALPQSGGQGSKTVQIVSRGKTIAQAFEEVNAKTGWYPKLVFCNLILLGENATERNVFDALDYFLRDDYLSDNCKLAVCDGKAKDILDTAALVEATSSLAIEKILSPHAERVGTVLTSTLREFSIGYFSESKSGYLPVVKKQPQQDEQAQPTQGGGRGGEEKGGNGQGGQSGESAQNNQDEKKKPTFSASETALFVGGKRVDTLTQAQTFALNAVIGKLRLAAYSVDDGEKTCTLSIRQNAPKIHLTIGDDGRASLTLDVTLTAGISDLSKSQVLEELRDVGEVPDGVFSAATKRLSGEIHEVFEKTRACGCDVFGVRERLIKYENRRFHSFKEELLQNALVGVNVRFENVR